MIAIRRPGANRRGLRLASGGGGGAPPGPVQLLDFDGPGATFGRSNGAGAEGDAIYRTSSATYGTALTDVIRSETLGGASRFLLEKQVTNLCMRSDQLGNTPWAAQSSTITANAVVGPSGATDADEVAMTASALAGIGQLIGSSVTADNTIYTIAVWARGAVGGELVRLAITNRANTIDHGSDIALTTSWQLITRTLNFGTGATQPTLRLRNGSDGAARTVYYCRASVTREGYATSQKDTAASSIDIRYADSLSFASDEVPLALRQSAWTCNVRPEWASGNLVASERRVLCSTDANNWIGFEQDSGSVYLRCYTGGALRFGTGALTIVRDTDYEIEVDLAGGVMTFGGVAGSTGTAATLPGGVSLRWGGMAGGTDEIDAGCSEPWSV